MALSSRARATWSSPPVHPTGKLSLLPANDARALSQYSRRRGLPMDDSGASCQSGEAQEFTVEACPDGVVALRSGHL